MRKVSFLCLEDGIWASEAEVEHPCLAISKILDNGFFYCSGDTSFDITSRHSARFAGDPHNPNVFDPRPRWTSPEIDHDPRFLWNTFLLNPLLAFRSMLPRRSREAFDGRTFAMPLIQGYIGSREVRLGGELTLLRAVSRLGWESAGTRFNRRGIDAAGNVGNFAEVSSRPALAPETGVPTCLLRSCADFPFFSHSYRPRRFSELPPPAGPLSKSAGAFLVRSRPPSLHPKLTLQPVYWSERCAQFSVDLTITRPLLTSLNPFLRHFSSLISHYSRIHSINLMRRANKGFLGAEAPLGEAYATLWEESCGRAERVEQRVAYEEFDFGEDKREQGIEDIPRLLKEAVGDVVGEFGGTLLRVGSEGEVPQLVRAQEGVFRVNCRGASLSSRCFYWFAEGESSQIVLTERTSQNRSCPRSLSTSTFGKQAQGSLLSNAAPSKPLTVYYSQRYSLESFHSSLAHLICLRRTGTLSRPSTPEPVR